MQQFRAPEPSVLKPASQQLGGSELAKQLHGVPDSLARTVYSFDELVEKILQSPCYMEVLATHSRLGERFLQHLSLIVELFKNHVYLRGKLENMTSLCEVQSYFSSFLIPGSSNSKAVLRVIYDVERENAFKISSPQRTGSTAYPTGNASDRATFVARQMRTADRPMGNQAVVGQSFGDQPSENLKASIFGSYDTSPHMEGDLYQFECFEDAKRMCCGREIPPEVPPRPSRYSVWNSVTGKWGC